MTHLLRVNGHSLRNINGKPIRNLVYQGVIYEIAGEAEEEEFSPTTLSLTTTDELTTVSFYVNKLDTTPTDVYINDELKSTLTIVGDNIVELVDLPVGDYTIRLDNEGSICFNQSVLSTMTLLTSVALGTNYGETIGANAFASATKLTAFQFSKKVRIIESQAFAKAGLTEIQLNDGLTTIGSSAFEACKFPQITIPASVTEIGDYAFALSSTSTSETGAVLDNLVFKNRTNAIITLGTKAFHQGKSARGVNISHYGNDSVLDYDWSANNITPTFIDLNSEA